jgi:hypothetical protein
MSRFTKFGEIFDLTPDQKEVANYKAQKRLILRNKYLQEVYNPNNMQRGHIVSSYL